MLPRRRVTRRDPPGPLAGFAVAAASVAVAACGSSGTSDAERFCGAIATDTAAVVAPPLASEAELEATLDHYRELADLAPIAIEREWRDLVTNLETASTVVPDDPESVQRVVVQAAATERSAVAVADWLLLNCSIDLGPVATITPHDPPAAPITSDGDGDGDDSTEPDDTSVG